jgi:hypothetical protein
MPFNPLRGIRENRERPGTPTPQENHPTPARAEGMNIQLSDVNGNLIHPDLEILLKTWKQVRRNQTQPIPSCVFQS